MGPNRHCRKTVDELQDWSVGIVQTEERWRKIIEKTKEFKRYLDHSKNSDV